MTKKVVALIISALLTVGILSGCTIDVNKIMENVSQSSSSSAASSSHIESDTEKISDTDSEISESTETDTQTDTETETDSDLGIDTSNLQTCYVTGMTTIPLYKDCSVGSDVITELPSGECVKFISDNGTGYAFMYYEPTHSFGYVENLYFVEKQSEVTAGETYYVRDNKAALYSNKERTEVLKYLNKNLEVSVIAKDSSGYWLVKPNKSDTIGYVSASVLSEEDLTSSKTVSSKTESKVESKTESKTESKAESKVESKTESKTESKVQSDEPIIGIGDAPAARYTVYSVNVESGYLALRSEQNSGDYCIIGELYAGEEVYVINSSDSYWYVYAPTLGMYGYVNGEFVVKS